MSGKGRKIRVDGTQARKPRGGGPGRMKGIAGRQRRAAWLFLAPSLAGVALFTGIPFADVVRRSFLSPMGERTAGWSNYASVWGNTAFQLAFRNTARFLAVCIPLLLAVSFLLALLIFRRDGKGGFYKTTLVLPMVIPVAAMVLVWKIILCRDGVLNQLLSGAGMLVAQIKGTAGQVTKIWDKDWVNGPDAFAVLVVTYIWKNAGYDLLLWTAGLAAIPESLYDAARVDGAGVWARLRYVTLPGIAGTGGLVLILSIVNSFRVYREAYLLAGSYPDTSIYMVPHLFAHWFLTLDVQNMCTASMILVMAFLAAAVMFALVWAALRRR